MSQNDDETEKSFLQSLSGFIDQLKTNRTTQIISGVILLTLVGGYFGVQELTKKPMGTWRYGICKVVVERHVFYPSSVNILAAGEKSASALIYYNKRNAFGDERLHLIDCQYGRDDRGIFLKSVTLDGRPMDNEFIQSISDTIPHMLASNSFDTELPQGFSLNLSRAKDRNPKFLDPVYDVQ